MNTGFTVPEGQTLTLTSAHLLAVDADNPTVPLTFTLTSLPANGALTKNGVPLTISGAFTQQDVLDGLIAYAHNGSETTSDGFGFQLSGAAGTTRVSVHTSGTQGNNESRLPSISADGRYTAFESIADNLVAGDTNGTWDVFVRDLMTGATTRVSVGDGGVQGNVDSISSSISADGRYVAFQSNSDNLVAGDTNGRWDIFVRDLVAGTTTRVSVDSGEIQGNDNSFEPSISGDGRYVAFRSFALNLTSDDSNFRSDVFVRDLVAGTTTRASVGNGGFQADLDSYRAVISANGRYVAFQSNARNLAPGDGNFSFDVFVRDLVAGTTTWISVDPGGLQGSAHSYNPSISADGRYVAFESWAVNLVAGDTNGRTDIFVRDLLTGVTSLVSVDSGGLQATNDSAWPSISADGRYVAFESFAGNLAAGDTNGLPDVFVRDRVAGTTTRVSVDSGSLQGNSSSLNASISADGRYTAFGSASSNMAPGDTNAKPDVFVRDRGVLSATTAVTITPAPPTVSDASFLATGAAAFGATSLTVTFSEQVVGANLAANYRLTRAGLDGVPGTADDVIVPISNASLAGKTATLNFAGLIGGNYRLRVEDAIVDAGGLALDGDANGVAGGDWVRDFFVQPVTLTPLATAPTATGIRITLSAPAVVNESLNLYDYRNTGGTLVLGAADVQLTNGAGQTIAGSLIVDTMSSTFTFVATAGTLPPDSYTLSVRSAANGFRTAAGDLLDGNGDGVTGDNYVTTFNVATPPASAITVSLPNFARGPEQVVNVPASSALGLPIQVSDGGGLTAMSFDLLFDVGLLNVTGVTLVGGGTANLTPVSPGRVQVALTFATPLASGAHTVAYLTAAVPTSAAARYGEREVLDISALSLTAGGVSVPSIDQDAVHVNAYFGDAGRNGRYDSFDVQQASRLALRLDTGFQQHPLLDPTLIADFNGNGRIDSFDVQRLSRLALRLPVTETAALPSPLPTTTDTDRLTDEEPPKSEPVKTEPEVIAAASVAPRSDVDGDGAVDAQDVAWAIYYFNRSENGVVPAEAQRKKLDLNGDQLFDAADIVLAITDLNTQSTSGEGECTSATTTDGESEEGLDSLTYLLAEDLEASRKNK